MAGGYALFVAGKIFANVTVEGRLGLKLPVAWCFEDLAALPGAGAWKLGQKTMEGWVLVPESFHSSDAALREWVERAHGCAIGKVPATRPDASDASEAPPTARSRSVPPNGASPRAHAIAPPPQSSAPALIVDDLDARRAIAPAPRSRSSRSLVPAPPSSRNGYDFSHYAPPPPSSLGIRVVPRDSKSPYEETLIGVPAPSSSSPELPDAEPAEKKR
jgi:hypothetical protein